MTYATEHIAQTLKSARETRGLSQRALSAKVGVPQSHISKIENGAVDLRVSSLTELARAFDLELMLVPRKSVSAVRTITRSNAMAAPGTRLAPEELTRLLESITSLMQTYPDSTELAQIKRQAHELTHFPIPEPGADVLQRITDRINRISSDTSGTGLVGDSLEQSTVALRLLGDSLTQISKLRNDLAHGAGKQEGLMSVQPAYSVDEDGHGQ